MIKLIIYDLDNTLVNASREIHKESFLTALKEISPEHSLSEEEHLAKYCGLSTSSKLNKLTQDIGLPKELHNEIWSLKQEKTYPLLKKITSPNNVIQCLRHFDHLKQYCCSNSVEKTVRLSLFYTGLMEYIDKYYGNDNVRPKPSTDIYLQAILDAKVNVDEVLIIEDSPRGVVGASKTGAYVMQISGPQELTIENIEKKIMEIEEKHIKPKWKSDMQVVIPMAGLGSRFTNYSHPKPLLDVFGKTMIETVVRNLSIDCKYTFIVRKEHYEKYNLQHLLNIISPNCNIVQLDRTTQGSACTVLEAEEFIDREKPILLANSDQFVEWDSNEFLYSSQSLDFSILTFKGSSHPKWSYSKLDDNGFVIETAEKRVISDHPHVGIFWWKKAGDMIDSFNEMINQEKTVNGEYYVAESINYLIKEGKRGKIFDCDKMWGIGDPEGYEKFISLYKGTT